MKKLALITVLALLTLPAFSQEKDSRTPFQGIWYGVIYGEDKVVFIFIDDIFICNLDGGGSGHYSVENNNLIITKSRRFDWDVDGWGKETPDEVAPGKIQYVFSGDKLILVFGGEPITFSRDYTDFSEWRY
jgi:hypothetical protein